MTSHRRLARLLSASLLIAVLAIGLAACGGSDDATDEGTGGAAAVEAATGSLDVVSAVEAWSAFDSGEAIMIDVREPEELAEQKVPGTIDIPLGELDARLAEIPNDKPVLVLCRSGNRARPAAELLAASGYEASVVDGGIIAWDSSGLPYEGSPPA
jgi:rhodanese-related sulfurtransferase